MTVVGRRRASSFGKMAPRPIQVPAKFHTVASSRFRKGTRSGTTIASDWNTRALRFSGSTILIEDLHACFAARYLHRPPMVSLLELLLIFRMCCSSIFTIVWLEDSTCYWESTAYYC